MFSFLSFFETCFHCVSCAHTGMEARSEEIAERKIRREEREREKEREREERERREEEERREREQKEKEAAAAKRREEKRIAKQVNTF